MTEQYGVILFPTTSAVMRAEKLLLSEGLTIKLVPTPREFSSDCGIAIRFAWSSRDRIRDLFREAGVEIGAVHLLDSGGQENARPASRTGAGPA